MSVHFISGESPHLVVHIEYTLANTGNAPLHFLDVALPSSAGFGSAKFRAQINGNEVAVPPPSAANSQTRIPLSFDWRQKDKIALAFSYDLAATPPTDSRILIAPRMFLLNDSGWFPTLLPFKALFSPKVSRPGRVDLSILVPAGFRATASGQPRGTKKRDGEVAYRFRIGKGDFDPYVAAGEYNEQRVSSSGVAVVLWTFNPISSLQSQKIVPAIAAAVKFDSQTFGRLPRSMRTLYDIELPQDASGQILRQDFLPGVVFNSNVKAKKSILSGTSNDPLPAFEQMQIGHTWFGHVIRPSPEAWFLSTGLAAYSVRVLNEDATGAYHTQRVHSELRDYDNVRAGAVEKPIIAVKSTDPQAQLQISFDKMQLFFAALEDKCGQQNVTHAIAHMVYALQGGEYGYSEFRSALEQQCHQDLADFFRTWLAQPGIPPDFRARYEGASSGTHSISQ